MGGVRSGSMLKVFSFEFSFGKICLSDTGIQILVFSCQDIEKHIKKIFLMKNKVFNCRKKYNMKFAILIIFKCTVPQVLSVFMFLHSRSP